MYSCPSPSDCGSSESADPSVVILSVPKCIIAVNMLNYQQNAYAEYLIYGVRAIMVGKTQGRAFKLPSSSQDSKSEAIMYLQKNRGDSQWGTRVVTSIMCLCDAPVQLLRKPGGSRQPEAWATPSQLLCQMLRLYWNILSESLALGMELSALVNVIFLIAISKGNEKRICFYKAARYTPCLATGLLILLSVTT